MKKEAGKRMDMRRVLPRNINDCIKYIRPKGDKNKEMMIYV